MHLVPSTDFPLIVSRAILTLCLSRRVTIERPPPPPGRHLVCLFDAQIQRAASVIPSFDPNKLID